MLAAYTNTWGGVRGVNHVPSYSRNPVQTFLDYQEAVVQTCAQLHADESCAGDVLAFLPGQEEILAVASLLEDRLRALDHGRPKPSFLVVALYAALSRDARRGNHR